LHVGDLPIAERDHLVALVPPAIVIEPDRRPDDHVVAHALELRLHLGSLGVPFLNLELQDLTGLVGTASGGRAFPPQVPARDAAPFGVLREQ